MVTCFPQHEFHIPRVSSTKQPVHPVLGEQYHVFEVKICWQPSPLFGLLQVVVSKGFVENVSQ
jgi:hypothetical protein